MRGQQDNLVYVDRIAANWPPTSRNEALPTSSTRGNVAHNLDETRAGNAGASPIAAPGVLAMRFVH
jgi:hypothetical protein